MHTAFKVCTQQRSFTKAVRKILLIKDQPGLGFAGEICFVKPGYAFNQLVPSRTALFYSDPAVKSFELNEAELKTKQDIRSLEIFLSKLKDIRITFLREVSEINKNVAKRPVLA